MVFRILKTWLLREMHEPVALLALDVTTGEHKKGNTKGLNYVYIKGFKGDKMIKLSFEKTSMREGRNTYMLQEKMNKYCVVSLIMFYIENHLPTGWEGPLILQKAKVSKIKTRKSMYNQTESDPKKPFVMDTLNTVQKIFAKRCKFGNWERYVN